jgi:hypothetical protein
VPETPPDASGTAGGIGGAEWREGEQMPDTVHTPLVHHSLLILCVPAAHLEHRKS